jgi:hypothetical protein
MKIRANNLFFVGMMFLVLLISLSGCSTIDPAEVEFNNLLAQAYEHLNAGRFEEAYTMSFRVLVGYEFNAYPENYKEEYADVAVLREKAIEGSFSQAEHFLQENRFDEAEDTIEWMDFINSSASYNSDFSMRYRSIKEAKSQFIAQQEEEKRRVEDQQRRAEQKAREALARQQQEDQEREKARIAAQGHARIYSAYSGTVLVNGNETDFTVEENNEVNITIENAKDNQYILAVRGSDGNVYLAENEITIQQVGYTQSPNIVNILNPNPSPNNPNDFDIRQNAEGGITITGYTGTRRQVAIPETISGIKVTEIGDSAFQEKNILTLVIPDTVTAIGAEAFYYNQIQHLILPLTLENIGRYAFDYNQITELMIPTSLKNIGICAFADNKIENLTLPESLEFVGVEAFRNNNITSLIINGVTQVGATCFKNNPITSVTYPLSWGNNNQLNKFAFSQESYGYSTDIYNNIVALLYNDDVNNDITRVTIPANVPDDSLVNGKNNFRDFYISQGRKGGTYTFSERIWRIE